MQFTNGLPMEGMIFHLYQSYRNILSPHNDMQFTNGIPIVRIPFHWSLFVSIGQHSLGTGDVERSHRKNDTLIIRDFRVEDAGNYICVATSAGVFNTETISDVEVFKERGTGNIYCMNYLSYKAG